MHVITRLFVCVVIIWLAGCTDQKYKIQAAHTEAKCKILCQQRLVDCNKICHKNCHQCGAEAQCSSVRSYHRYKQEQCVQGGMMVRELNSYHDPLQCRKPTCNCSADYRVCVQSCAGIIHKRLQVPPTCC